MRSYLPDYAARPMLWTPVVFNQGPEAKYNQLDDVAKIAEYVRAEFNLELECVVNEQFKERLGELRKVAAKETKELKSPIMRFFQIEARLDKHLERLGKKAASSTATGEAPAVTVTVTRTAGPSSPG